MLKSSWKKLGVLSILLISYSITSLNITYALEDYLELKLESSKVKVILIKNSKTTKFSSIEYRYCNRSWNYLDWIKTNLFIELQNDRGAKRYEYFPSEVLTLWANDCSTFSLTPRMVKRISTLRNIQSWTIKLGVDTNNDGVFNNVSEIKVNIEVEKNSTK